MDNITISLTIILGIVSGILTTLFLLLANYIFRHLLIPWYQRLIYKGIDLNGTWLGYMHDSDEIDMPFTMVIKQSAHNISGTATIIKSLSKDIDKSTIYDIAGYVWEGYITINFQSIDRTRLAFATTLLQICKGGRCLTGRFIFRDLRADEIRERQLLLHREDYVFSPIDKIESRPSSAAS